MNAVSEASDPVQLLTSLPNEAGKKAGLLGRWQQRLQAKEDVYDDCLYGPDFEKPATTVVDVSSAKTGIST